jgi:hypothetical protein
VQFEWFEWDDDNIVHATRHGVSVSRSASRSRTLTSSRDPARTLGIACSSARRPTPAGASWWWRSCCRAEDFDHLLLSRMIAND